MDYYDQIESARGKSPTITDWEHIPAETVEDPKMSTHSGTVRKTWVGTNVVLTRVVVKGSSKGKPHFHPSEQVSMIMRGGARVFMNGTEQIAGPGAIVHIPAGTVHMFEILDEETEILDVYHVKDNAEELRKGYPA